MPINPFSEDELDEFYGIPVRVTHDSAEYEGWVRRIYGDMDAVVMQDVTAPDGESLGAVTLREPDRIERVDSTPDIRTIPLAEVTPSVYDCHSDTKLQTQALTRIIRRRGHLIDYPVVRPVESEYEIVDGHGRLKAARRADLNEAAMEVVPMSDWEAAERFVEDHVPPIDSDPDEEGKDWYSDEQINQVIETLQSEWSDSRLKELRDLQPYLD